MSKLLPPAALVAEARRVGRPCPPQAGGGSRAPSRTTSLPFPQAKNLINALAFAESLLPPSAAWAHATICLGQSPHDISDPRRYLALQGRILARVREWLLSLGLPAHCLWVREIGPRYGGPHSHILLPLPPERRPDLAELIHRVGTLHDTSNNRAVVVTPERCRWSAEADKADTRGLHTRARRAGVLRDLLKTMAPRARLDGTPIMPALAIRPRAQCTILGKRSGTSETLNRTARARAGWRELETLAELRAALPTGEDARKERQRDNQRRRRARKRAGIAPMPWSPTRRPEAVPELDPFAVDLAADFFEEA